MIRVTALDGEAVVAGGRELATSGRLRWVDVEGQTAEEVEWLGRTFGFHHLALEDCLHLGQRPKIEAYPSALFVVLHTFSAPETAPTELQVHELHAFLTADTLVTVHADPMPQIEQLRPRVAEPRELARGPGRLLYLLCDAIIDAEYPVFTAIHEEIDELEELGFERPDPETLHRIVRVKRVVLRLRRTLIPAREVILQLHKREDEQLGGRNDLYFRDVVDHAQRNTEQLELARERINDLLEARHSAATNRTNEIIKRLTLFSAIFLPLTFVTGFFGMNFHHLPFSDDHFLAAAVLGMVLLPVAMVVWFRWSRWI